MTKNGSGSLRVCAVLRDLPLLHRFEQRALRLRRRAVDLVGEHHRMEDRARVEAERAASRSSKIDTPSTSAGRRSLVNWTRAYLSPSVAASACASVDLPTPGMSSISRWPRASRHASASLSGSSLPTTMRPSCAQDCGEALGGRDVGLASGANGHGRVVRSKSAVTGTLACHAGLVITGEARGTLRSAGRAAPSGRCVRAPRSGCTRRSPVLDAKSPCPPPSSRIRRSFCTTWGRTTPSARTG